MINYILLFLSISLETGKNAAFDYFGKNKLSDAKNLHLFNTITYIGALPVLLITLFLGQSRTLSLFTLGSAVGFAVVNLLAQLFYIKAISCGSMTLTTLITCCGFIISTVFSVLWYAEPVRILQVVLLPLLILALALTMNLERGRCNVRWILYAAGSMVSTGLIGVMQKVHQESAYSGEIGMFLLIAFAVMAAVSAVLFLGSRGSGADGAARVRGAARMRPDMTTLLAAGSGAALGTVHSLNLYLSGVLPAILFFPIANGGLILMTAAVSMVVFREKLNVKQWVGLIMGVVIICLM